MTKSITINFKNLVSEMQSKQVELCFIGNGFLFLQDSKGNLYSLETIDVGSYLDDLIKNERVITFIEVDLSKRKNVKEYTKRVWGTTEVLEFIKNQSL